MTPKEKSEELISQFTGYVYPYCGSDFMTGTENEHTKRFYAIKCAIIVVDEIMKIGSLNDEEIYVDTIEYLGFWESVKLELQKMN